MPYAAPFLYLPDAISLTILLLALCLLRRSAIAHLRQELIQNRKDLLLLWFENDLPHNHMAYTGLSRLIDDAIKLVPRISPARLYFLFRLSEEVLGNRPRSFMPWPDDTLSRQFESIPNKRIREKLWRIRLEMNFSLGTFYLMGSLSGWLLSCSIMLRLLRKSFSHSPRAGMDAFFDLAEKTLARTGRHVQRLIFLTKPSGYLP
jgi:hypothetical protein